MAMKKLAWTLAQDLLSSAVRKRKWTAHERKQWTLAFNALKRLSGKK